MSEALFVALTPAALSIAIVLLGFAMIAPKSKEPKQ